MSVQLSKGSAGKNILSGTQHESRGRPIVEMIPYYSYKIFILGPEVGNIIRQTWSEGPLGTRFPYHRELCVRAVRQVWGRGKGEERRRRFRRCRRGVLVKTRVQHQPSCTHAFDRQGTR